MSRKHKIDTTRASREGHEFHEAWTARKALQLFWPDKDLVGISVEGLSPDDQGRASKAAVEIADIALYFGKVPSFQHGARKTIAQFKYSIADKDKDFRASNAQKTITKFAKTFSDYKKKYGAQSIVRTTSPARWPNPRLPQDPRRAGIPAHPGRCALGTGADESVHSLLDAVYSRMPYTEFQRHVRIHPTVSELLPTVLEDLSPLD